MRNEGGFYLIERFLEGLLLFNSVCLVHGSDDPFVENEFRFADDRGGFDVIDGQIFHSVADHRERENG